MNGLFYPDGSFKTEQELKREAILNKQSPDPIFETPLPKTKDFSYWSNRMQERQAQFQETNERVKSVEISFPDTTILNFIGDIHAGSGETDYARLEQELKLITNTPNSYVILIGDIIDGYAFNPGQMEEIEQVPEQIMYYRSLIRFLADHKRLLVGFSGDHDGSWQQKVGVNIYNEFAEDTGAYYMEGVGYITAYVNGIPYKIVVQHRPRGHSIYNNSHGAMRLGREAEGADIAVVGHNHCKGVSQQPVKEYGGSSRLVTYVAVGPYKKSDYYSRKMGYVDSSDPDSLYGASVILHKDKKLQTPYFDILEGNRRMLDYLEA